MKQLILKTLPWTLAIIAITLGILTGKFIVYIFKAAGANMLTIHDVFGCYVAGVMIWGFMSLVAYVYLLEILNRK